MTGTAKIPDRALPEKTNALETPSLGQRIREARGIMRQAQLAAESGVSDRTISTIERGTEEGSKYKPKAETIARLALALKITDPMEWVRLCEDSSDFTEADLQRLRGEMMQAPGYEPAAEIYQKVNEKIESEVQEISEEIDALRQHIDMLPKGQQQVITRTVHEVLLDGYEPAETLKRQFSEDLTKAEMRLIGRMDDLRRLVDQIGEQQMKLLTSLVQTQMAAAQGKPE